MRIDSPEHIVFSIFFLSLRYFVDCKRPSYSVYCRDVSSIIMDESSAHQFCLGPSHLLLLLNLKYKLQSPLVIVVVSCKKSNQSSWSALRKVWTLLFRIFQVGLVANASGISRLFYRIQTVVYHLCLVCSSDVFHFKNFIRIYRHFSLLVFSSFFTITKLKKFYSEILPISSRFLSFSSHLITFPFPRN